MKTHLVYEGEGWWTVRRPQPRPSQPRRRPRNYNKPRRGNPIAALFPSLPQTNSLLSPSVPNPTSTLISSLNPPVSFTPPPSPPTSPQLHIPSSHTIPEPSTMPSHPTPQPDPSPSAVSWYDTDPFTKKAYSTDPYLTGKVRLHLPPEPSKLCWKQRCFKCLVRGHSVSDCPAPLYACARCLRPGHSHSDCQTKNQRKRPTPAQPKDLSVILRPRGNIGEDKLPSNMLPSIDAFLPQSSESITDLRYLTKGMVVDARLKPGCFGPETIQAALLSYAPDDGPYPVIHMANDRYLVLVDGPKDRAKVIAAVRSNFEAIGLVIYPWSPAIDAETIDYRFKVWIDLHHMPITAWNKQQLISLTGQFGLLLEHASFNNVASLARLRCLVAVRYLEDIPRTARLTNRFLRRPIKVEVLGWIDEPTSIRTPTNPTPSASYFADVAKRLRNNPPPSLLDLSRMPLHNSVALDFELALRAWVAMPESQLKKELGKHLQYSPFWSIAKFQELLRRQPQPTFSLPSHSPVQPDPLLGNTAVNSSVTPDQVLPLLATENPSADDATVVSFKRFKKPSLPARHVPPPGPTKAISSDAKNKGCAEQEPLRLLSHSPADATSPALTEHGPQTLLSPSPARAPSGALLQDDSATLLLSPPSHGMQDHLPSFEPLWESAPSFPTIGLVPSISTGPSTSSPISPLLTSPNPTLSAQQDPAPTVSSRQGRS